MFIMIRTSTVVLLSHTYVGIVDISFSLTFVLLSHAHMGIVEIGEECLLATPECSHVQNLCTCVLNKFFFLPICYFLKQIISAHKPICFYFLVF